MQMRRMYVTTNKAIRIQYHKAAAAECAKAGLPGLAEVNEEMAVLLQGEINAANKAARDAEDE